MNKVGYELFEIAEYYDFFPLYNYSYYDISLVITEHIGREFRKPVPILYFNLN